MHFLCNPSHPVTLASKGGFSVSTQCHVAKSVGFPSDKLRPGASSHFRRRFTNRRFQQRCSVLQPPFFRRGGGQTGSDGELGAQHGRSYNWCCEQKCHGVYRTCEGEVCITMLFLNKRAEEIGQALVVRKCLRGLCDLTLAQKKSAVSAQGVQDEAVFVGVQNATPSFSGSSAGVFAANVLLEHVESHDSHLGEL